MWYRSIITNKIVNSYHFRSVDLIYGDGVSENLIKMDFLIPVENPSVIDILRDTHSDVMAMIRYREIHHCGIKEARNGVNAMKKDMARKYTPRKRRWKHKKKESKE